MEGLLSTGPTPSSFFLERLWKSSVLWTKLAPEKLCFIVCLRIFHSLGHWGPLLVCLVFFVLEVRVKYLFVLLFVYPMDHMMEVRVTFCCVYKTNCPYQGSEGTFFLFFLSS